MHMEVHLSRAWQVVLDLVSRSGAFRGKAQEVHVTRITSSVVNGGMT